MASEKQIGNIVYEVELEVAKLIEAQRNVNDRLDKMSGSADKAGGSFDKLERKADSLGGGFTNLASAVKAYITVQAAMKLVETAQQFELLSTRVTMASKSAAEGEANFRALLAISAQNGSDLKETVNLFTQMSATLKSVGATSGDVQRLVSTLQKIGTIGGSSQEEMNNALRQFMQSMASGRVQAEEFNSIIEQMPELGRQIADGMGIPFDQLRQQMLAGKLDIGSVLEAIYKQTDDVNTKFEAMPRTVAQASNALVNSLGMAVAQVDQKIGATKYFAKLLDGAALTVNLAVGNASAIDQIDQKLLKNSSDLQVAEKSLNIAKESGVEWAVKQAQATVDRLNAEKRILAISKQTANDVQASTSGQTTGKESPDYIRNLAAKSATSSAQAIISAGQSEVEKLQAQRNQLKANYAKRLVDKETYAKADAVLSQKISDAEEKANKPAANAAKKLANEQQSVADKLESLRQKSELTASSTSELSREQAILQAQQSIGKAATAEQIRQAGEYAAKTYDAAKAVRDLAQSEQGRKFATQEIAAAAVMPDAVTGAVENPTAQIDLQEQQKLAALAKYQALDVQNAQLYEDAKTAIQRQAANARQQIAENEANMQSQAISSIIGSVSQGFDGLANLAAGAAGKSSGAYQAMFALSKGFAVAQAALNLQLAISQAMADPTALTPAQKFANYAAIASAGASLLTSIGSISMGGAREHGGPVNASSMYRVGEGGKPEIFKASNGSQYMIPGDNGSVISNRDLGGAGGGGSTIQQEVHFHIQTTNGIDDATMNKMAGMMKQVALYQMKDQSTRPGGMLQPRK
ncbi:hypothetical protein CIL06_11505 [Pantoea vagans]|uniref:tape measure protein n=1 Tax=Pantoea vagans TaxID=470934 RepID=UPI000BACCFC2|nr:tape measure protein [Pantoea vagans]PAW36290.1 hypothetical protein CIL06_11505 [Pantoea vagans]